MEQHPPAPDPDPESAALTSPASPPREPLVEALEQRLGVQIGNVELALAALTHKSFVNEHRGEALRDNERLEFLGDAVIDLAVSHRLMERFPEAREGELSKIRAAMVDEAGLALMARACDLGSLLRLGRGEELTGGRQKSSLLADGMEAVVAALYLDGGLDPVLAVLDRFLGAAFEQAAAGTLDRDYKTQFQELAQSRLRSAPRYRVVAEHGPDHSKVFEVELELKGEVVGHGAGRSKKDAEQAAAKLALETINGRYAEARGSEASPEPDAGAAVSVEPAAAPELIASEEVAAAEVVAREPAAAPPGPRMAPAEPLREEVAAPPEEPAPPPAAQPSKRKPAAASGRRPRPAGKRAVGPGRAGARKPALARARKPRK